MDKELIKQAMIDVLDEGLVNKVPWRLYEHNFNYDSSQPNRAAAQRVTFTKRVIERYFELLRIELAKDGN